MYTVVIGNQRNYQIRVIKLIRGLSPLNAFDVCIVSNQNATNFCPYYIRSPCLHPLPWLKYSDTKFQDSFRNLYIPWTHKECILFFTLAFLKVSCIIDQFLALNIIKELLKIQRMCWPLACVIYWLFFIEVRKSDVIYVSVERKYQI